MAIAKKPRNPRKVKTTSDMEYEIKEKRQELERLTQNLAHQRIADKISSSTLVADFKKLLEDLNGEVSDIELLAAVGKELDIKRLVVTQAEIKKRATKGTVKAMTSAKKSLKVQT